MLPCKWQSEPRPRQEICYGVMQRLNLVRVAVAHGLRRARATSIARVLGRQRCGQRWLLGRVASSGGGLTTNTRVASCDFRCVRLRFFFVGTMHWRTCTEENSAYATLACPHGVRAAGPCDRHLSVGRTQLSIAFLICLKSGFYRTDCNGLGLAATTPFFARLEFCFCSEMDSEAIAELGPMSVIYEITTLRLIAQYPQRTPPSLAITLLVHSHTSTANTASPKLNRHVATSPEGYVQQVAVCYLRHGYWFYVTGRIPARKDANAVDRKLIAKYEIDITERQRAYRKQRGLANMQYIRFDRWFLLLITDGHHPFKQEEKTKSAIVAATPSSSKVTPSATAAAA